MYFNLFSCYKKNKPNYDIQFYQLFVVGKLQKVTLTMQNCTVVNTAHSLQYSLKFEQGSKKR